MNKKLLAAFVFLAVSLPSCAQDTGTFMPKHWQTAIEQKTTQATFENVIKTLEKPLTLVIPITKQFFDKNGYEAEISFNQTEALRKLEGVQVYPSTVGCKAYVLDEHWIMAGATCLWNGRHNITFTDRSGEYATGLVEPDTNRENLKINEVAIPWKNNLFVQPHETEVPHVILVRVPQDSKLSKRLQNWPKINVLAFNKTIPEILTNGKFYVNSARFGLNSVSARIVLPDHVNDGDVKVVDGWNFSGLSTDPLAYVEKGKLHWIAVNRGIMEARYNNLLGDWVLLRHRGCRLY